MYFVAESAKTDNETIRNIATRQLGNHPGDLYFSIRSPLTDGMADTTSTPPSPGLSRQNLVTIQILYGFCGDIGYNKFMYPSSNFLECPFE